MEQLQVILPTFIAAMYYLLTTFFFQDSNKEFCTVYSVKDISQLYSSSNLQRCWLCEPLEINPGNVVGQKHKRNQWADTPLPYLSISIFYQEKYRCKLFLIQRKHWQVLWVEKNSKLLGCSRPSWIPAARSKVTWETAALEEIHIPRISNYTETGFRVTHTRDLWFLIFLWISWFLQKQRSVGFFSSVQSQCQTDVSFYHKMSYLIFPSWSCFEFMLQLFQNPMNE